MKKLTLCTRVYCLDIQYMTVKNYIIELIMQVRVMINSTLGETPATKKATIGTMTYKYSQCRTEKGRPLILKSISFRMIMAKVPWNKKYTVTVSLCMEGS